MTSETALLVIDVQRGMLAEPDPVSGGPELLARLGGLIARARGVGVPVIYIQHGSEREGHPLRLGSEGWQIHPAIAPLPGELVIQKRWPDAFQETTLEDALRSRGIRHLVLTGIQTDYCVDTTCRRAFSLGYAVTLVADGHTTWSTPVLSAERIIAHHNRTLGNWFATITPASEIAFAAVGVGQR